MNLLVYLILGGIYACSLWIRRMVDKQQLTSAFENPTRARRLEQLYAALAVLNGIDILVLIGYTIYLIIV